MKGISRRSFALGAASLAACGRVQEDATPASADAAAPPLGDAAAPDVEAPRCLLGLLGDDAVSNRRPVRRTFYSWTTRAQADELAKTKVLYSRVADDAGRKGYLFDMLEARAHASDAAARFLTQPDFELGRYAWPVSWSAVAGFESYGPELLRIDVDPRALFVVVENEAPSPTYEVLDVDNNRLPFSAALAEPLRVAGIFFCNAAHRGTCGSLRGRLGYREFHLCHENLVVEWSLRTPELRNELARAEALLARIAEKLACVSTCPEALIESWKKDAPGSDADELAMGLLQSCDCGIGVAINALYGARVAAAELPPIRHRPNG